MQDAPKAVWSIPYVSVVFFPSLKQNFIAYRSSKVSSRADCIFEIHQLWQSGFSRVYSNSCCSCWFEREIIKTGQSSHKMYGNHIVNFQESTTILNTYTKKVWKRIECTTYFCLTHRWDSNRIPFKETKWIWELLLHILQSSKTGVFPSDGLVSYPRHSLQWCNQHILQLPLPDWLGLRL